MNKVSIRLFAAVCAIPLLYSCGGGGDSSGASATSSSAVTVTTAVGNATVQKTFQPNVTQFADNAIQQTGKTSFQISSPPSGFGVNSVFTWEDRPYVVTSITSTNPFAVTTRDAELGEVLSQIAVTGDITIDDANLARMVVADANNTNQTPSIINSSIRSTNKSTVTLGKCKVVQNDASANGSTTVSCTANEIIQPGVVISGTVGIKDISFSSVNLNKGNQTQSLASFQATPYVTLSGGVSTGQNTAATLTGNLPFARIRVPIQFTLGFVSIGIPFYLSYGLPLYNAGVGVTGSFPYTNGAFSFVGSLETPTATISTTTAFTAQMNNAFIGIKSGAELALTSTPTPVASAISVAVGWPLTDDRILSVGVFGTLGEYGSLSVSEAPPATTACLQYSMSPRVDTVLEESLLGNPIVSLGSAPLKILPALQITGSTGCNNTQLVVSSATCTNTTATFNGITAPLVYVQQNGTATGPVGTYVFADQQDYQGGVDGLPGSLAIACSAWSPAVLPSGGHGTPTYYIGMPTCQRAATDPETTSWSAFNYGPPQAAPTLPIIRDAWLLDSSGQEILSTVVTAVMTCQ
ncbi:hypothetical protein [Paraburkholderia sp. PGU19]|uniref:hypothetical protein n=1 Tax=Paraburkholderia sp. PGU19 TaxID=2735434 RepID=UPI0015D9772D|nr:hypothetical protein [Paraburkholderia sp. PGU19]